MNSWRKVILNHFVPNVRKLTLVADPDSLLSEEKLAWELRERGFELIEFSDPVEFRYAYESTYRSIWDRGEHTDLVVVLRLENAKLAALPYDLLQAGRELSFSLGALFPHLSYRVLEQLDRSLLDAVFEAQIKRAPERLGDNATMDFILRHVFGMAAELISTEVGLLRFLLRLHYGKMPVPMCLLERWCETLEKSGYFKGWGLRQIVLDAEQFFVFIQERWPIFLESLKQNTESVTGPLEYALKIQGPVDLPFEHRDIKVYIDNLFVEGKLRPVEWHNIEELEMLETEPWILSGLLSSKSADDDRRIARLFELIDESSLSKDFRYTDWIAFALKWAQLSALIHTCDGDRFWQQYLEKAGKVNAVFVDWLNEHYLNLRTLPTSNPAMVHHIPRYMARYREETGHHKLALLVVDGLSLDQWVSIKRVLQKQNSDFVFEESATFAWVPTLTSVSRQAIFSGKEPYSFATTIGSTASEDKLWKQYWEGQGVSKFDVAYKKGLGDGEVKGVWDESINLETTKIVGLVIDKVDKIMHGMQLGASGMHNQIEQWCEGAFLSKLICELLDGGYALWLTADHGNIECEGKGRPSEGSTAEIRGERVRVYPNSELREQVAKDHSFAHKWQSVGLPVDYVPLVASGRDAFVKRGDVIVGHGGIAIEEVIVPWVKIERKRQ